jgi:hypothetical protein
MIGIATQVQSDNRDVPESKKSKSLWQNLAWFIPLLEEGYANTYYAAGVKSMLTSWHNFFFVSFDSGGFVSLDKPPPGSGLKLLEVVYPG